MKTNNLNTTSTFTNENKKGFLLVVVLFLMTSFSSFAQSSTLDVVSTKEVVSVETKTALVLDDSQLDFMNWFMGSKQSQSTNDFTTVNDNSSSRRKQIISSGVTPNRVLYRTLLKKVVSQENAIV